MGSVILKFNSGDMDSDELKRHLFNALEQNSELFKGIKINTYFTEFQSLVVDIILTYKDSYAYEDNREYDVMKMIDYVLSNEEDLHEDLERLENSVQDLMYKFLGENIDDDSLEIINVEEPYSSIDEETFKLIHRELDIRNIKKENIDFISLTIDYLNFLENNNLSEDNKKENVENYFKIEFREDLFSNDIKLEDLLED